MEDRPIPQAPEYMRGYEDAMRYASDFLRSRQIGDSLFNGAPHVRQAFEILADHLLDRVESRRRVQDIERRLSQELVAQAVAAERERWKPAATYFERYCQDEADGPESCVCGDQQHKDAKAFQAVVRGENLNRT